MSTNHPSTSVAPSHSLVIRRAELPALLGLSIPTIDRLRAQGQFPVPRRLGQQAIGFLRADIDEWLANRPTVTH